MIQVDPYLYISIIGILLAIGVVAFILIMGEIVREWKEYLNANKD